MGQGMEQMRIPDAEMPKKKLKQSSREKRATMKNSYINGIKK
jgi:hypothetical protein